MPNDNHPKQGSSIWVSPIRDLKIVDAIAESLRPRLRNRCLFVVGVNVAWRANELVSLKVGHVMNAKPDVPVNLKQKKTNEYRLVILNDEALSAISDWLDVHPNPKPKAPLFISQTATGKPPTRKAIQEDRVRKLVKLWCNEQGLIENYGSHSLRKTWGYHQRVKYGVSTVKLMKAYGHSSEEMTERYLGILPDEIMAIYRNKITGVSRN